MFVAVLLGLPSLAVLEALLFSIRVSFDGKGVIVSQRFAKGGCCSIAFADISETRLVAPSRRLDIVGRSGQVVVIGPCHSIFGRQVAMQRLTAIKAAVDQRRGRELADGG